jgi:chloramphenicol O-acetyltransferase type A
MKRLLDIETWARRDHFRFFSQFEEPFFGITVRVDCTRAYEQSRDTGDSFFLLYLHRSLLAANAVEPFRYRIAEGKVWVFDAVHASPTINRPDGTFGFAYLNFEEDFVAFKTGALEKIEQVRASTALLPATGGENVIHYSSMPWLDFTAVSHARRFAAPDSSPKITFGKMTGPPGRLTMPVGIHAHHALMDGFHVGQFVERFQALM